MAAADAARPAFLKAAQAGDVHRLRELLATHASLLEARSTSKGYTALHYAAMAGAVSAIEWLHGQGLAADVRASVGDGITPLSMTAMTAAKHAATRIATKAAGSRLGSPRLRS